MPIYEYVCQDCRHRFEVKQSMADPPLSSCERCGKAVTKVISAPAIMFKGTGWYVTDYSDKMKPGTDSKAEEKSDPAQKKDSDSSAGTATPAGAATPASPAPSAGPASQPAAAGTGSSSTTPATPASSSPK
ncbi:MAG: zinc ribbon domain-containing protein [Nitrospiraceae bacterium]|nr:zinc ribbon domain-containing protein [Nitrospiraceae bacterium]MSR24946.1 zinc ribbon domain-containing protein [Nitrospiraceae bacterium]